MSAFGRPSFGISLLCGRFGQAVSWPSGSARREMTATRSMLRSTRARENLTPLKAGSRDHEPDVCASAPTSGQLASSANPLERPRLANAPSRGRAVASTIVVGQLRPDVRASRGGRDRISLVSGQ